MDIPSENLLSMTPTKVNPAAAPKKEEEKALVKPKPASKTDTDNTLSPTLKKQSQDSAETKDSKLAASEPKKTQESVQKSEPRVTPEAIKTASADIKKAEPPKTDNKQLDSAIVPYAEPRKEIPALASAKPVETKKSDSAPIPLVTDEAAQPEPAAGEEAPIVVASAPAKEIAATSEKKNNEQGLKKIMVWEAHEGSSLKKVLREWCKTSGIDLAWNTEENYDLSMDIYVSGTFENAIKTLFTMGVENPPYHEISKGDTTSLVVTDAE